MGKKPRICLNLFSCVSGTLCLFFFLDEIQYIIYQGNEPYAYTIKITIHSWWHNRDQR